MGGVMVQSNGRGDNGIIPSSSISLFYFPNIPFLPTPQHILSIDILDLDNILSRPVV